MHSLNESRKYISTLRIILLGVVIGILTGGCASSESKIYLDPEETFDPGSNGGVWDSPAGRMGVVPIMPPSEDVRVGDMFVYPFNPDVYSATVASGLARGLSTSPRWATLSLLDELEQEYQLRPAWPATPDAYLQISDNPEKREWAEAQAPQNQSIFARDSVTDRLRNIGLAEFSTFTLVEGNVNALLPTEVINLVLGSAWNDDKALTIRLNSAETYSLGLQKVIEVAIGDSDQVATLKSPYRNQLRLVADPLSSSVWVRVLSDVVYVRSIDFIIQSTSGFETDDITNANEFVVELEETVTRTEEEMPAAEDDDNETAAESRDDESQQEQAAAQTEGEESQQDEATVDVVVTETVTESLPDHELDPAFAAFVRANAINEILIASDSDDLPGGFLRFVSVTNDSVTVRRIWKRGLAVGGRGLTLEVNKDTGEILRSGHMGTLLP
jgi:hypothetical protein